MADDAIPRSLLDSDEPSPFNVENPDGPSDFFLICDHAGQRVPRALGDLGVSAADMQRHVAWDIGALGVAKHLASILDACLIWQTYSRLVIDCNRPLHVAGSIVIRSELTDVPGNIELSADAAMARVREIFLPYHARIEAELVRRRRLNRPTILVSVHSFTPVYMGVARPWHIGMLYNRDGRIAQPMLQAIRAEGEWNAGDKQPYAVSDTSDYAIPVYGEAAGRLHIGLEVRQDLVDSEAGQIQWAHNIARWLIHAANSVASHD